MLKNYFKIAFRNLLKSKGYSLINISGLAVGMAVAILIGLWVHDELAFDKYHTNYDKIAQVLQNQEFNGVTQTMNYMPYPLGNALRTKYGGEFKYVVMASMSGKHYLALGGKTLTKTGMYMEPDAPAMFSLKMIRGSKRALEDPSSILISQSVSSALFGKADPLGRTLTIDNRVPAKVAGVYENLPDNTTFKTLEFIAPWSMYVASQQWVADSKEEWDNSSFQTFTQIADHADFEEVSAKIRNIKYDAVDDEKRFKPVIFLHPMSKWHLYSEFKNGSSTGGKIQFVWLFGMIGFFVLILACINFMNLSTARSEKRAKEVGIRKTMGSIRIQLVWQFFSESFLVVLLAFIFSLLLVILITPLFNQVADKKVGILWANGWFWLASAGFIVFTGIIAGSYPALYLSSFQPVKVLKGTFRVGRFVSLPRKILVVVQFSVSIVLIIGTIIVFRQINFAKDRPVGYDRTGLIMVEQNTSDIVNHFDAFRAELLRTGAVTEAAISHSPPTGVWRSNSGFDWKGKDPSQTVDFATSAVSHEFGKTLDWQFIQGRDFSRKMASDSSGIVINEAAVKFMGLENPIGEIVRWNGQPLTIIGVIKNMIMESPYKEPKPTVFHIMGQNNSNFVTTRLTPGANVRESLAKIETVFKKYSAAIPFNYKFVDQDYAYKFVNEEQVGELATLFAGLAIFISCLGLFGMASFTAEQRTKEIGVRKVLGASVANLWKMLSREFVVLVLISFLIAAPIATYLLHRWLQSYEYRTEISWWIYIISASGALAITLITISFQAIKAAVANPVKSLRSE
ncbi:MAG TPA: ABC transporter permease [Daejeonella sp.]